MTAKTKKWVIVTARIGYVAKGIVYFSIGLLALEASMGMSSTPTGTTKILEHFISKPYGSVLLTVCMLGLLAHAAWRIINGVYDPEQRGNDLSALLFRVIDVLTGLLYISVSYAAWQILRGLRAQSSDQSTEVWVGKILQLPYGKWIVLFFSVVIIVTGLYQFYSAYTASFDYSFDIERMSHRERTVLRQLGRIGFTAWGVVYCMIAFLFYQAAVTYDPDEAGGLGDALQALSKQPYGIWVLTITSAGLLIYGIYLWVLAYYHKIYGNSPLK